MAVLVFSTASALLIRPISGFAADLPLDASVPTSQPAPEANPQRPVQEILAEFQSVTKQLNAVIPASSLSDPNALKDAGPKAIPILYHHLQLTSELETTKKIPMVTLTGIKQSDLAMLYMFNDGPTVNKVKGMVASGDMVRQIDGQSVEIRSRWMTAGGDKTESKNVVDDVEKLDRAHPDNSQLTLLTLSLAQSGTGANKDRLLSLLSDVMTDPLAKRIKDQIASEKATVARQNAMLNKPMVISAKTVDGKDFTTADWKGKVILVDFWATWCGPCREGLPHVVETYSKYHDKGFEIVGISDDFDIKALQDFTPKNGMPWPQLIDADAAAKHQPNPLVVQYGVEAIPTMFLIDKTGNLRSVTAREEMDDLIPKLLAE